jgi:ATP-dependent RNA helicase DOB1
MFLDRELAMAKRKAEEQLGPAVVTMRKMEEEEEEEAERVLVPATTDEEGKEVVGSQDVAEPQLTGALSGNITCLHEVSFPEGYEAPVRVIPNSPSKPAKEYPFTLDPFQREAIKCLEAGESVLVSFKNSFS